MEIYVHVCAQPIVEHQYSILVSMHSVTHARTLQKPQHRTKI
jgi:hypothetical protein